MAAPKGNQFWKARAKSGRDKIFSTPDALWDAAVEYFEWVDANPLWEAKYVQHAGEPVDLTFPVMRAMTIKGLCIFLGVNGDYFTDFKDNLKEDDQYYYDFSRIIRNIYDVIDTQKFEGAAAGQLNANIIARDLGLKEASTQELSGPGGKPIAVRDMSGYSDDELQAIIDEES